MTNEDKSYLIPYTLDVEGVSYILDLESYHEAVKMPPRKVMKVVEGDDGKETEIEETEDGGLNVSKYELLKYVLEVVMDEKGGEDIDSAMGMAYGFKKMPFSFKLSFNTLLSYGIIKPIN
tara:strand:- start:38141 stop:38500 length:360 start_codon:yes stop_codon:yes gene_type:complete